MHAVITPILVIHFKERFLLVDGVLYKEYASSWVVSSAEPVLDEANLYHSSYFGECIPRRYPLKK